MITDRTLTLGATFAAGGLLTLLLLNTEPLGIIGLGSAQANNALYAPRDWRQGAPSKLNISVFTFSDRNRNGVYDTADKPLNRIAVRLTRPDGSTRIERSNINGFANFAMQNTGDDADITRVGEPYQFRVLPPPGWNVSTGNAVQESSFRTIDGAIAGMGADSPPSVVGLTPPATITGGTARKADKIAVAYAPVVLGTTVPPRAARGESPATVTVGFDDLQRSAIEKVAAGYAGLDWDYLLAVDNQFYKGPGYVNGLMSGAMVAYNSSGHPVTVRGLPPKEYFDFVGGYFTVAWHNAEGETLHIKAWRGDVLVAEDSFSLSHLTPSYFFADYQDITRLQFETEHYWQFVADDLQFRLSD